MLRILIAAASAPTRELLIEALASHSDIEVVGSAATGAEVVEMTTRLRPSLVVVDMGLRGVDGFETTRRIMTEAPTPIVITTDRLEASEVEISLNALRAGALAVAQKPGGSGSPGFVERRRQLVATVRAMAEVKLVRRWPERLLRSEQATKPAGSRARIVAIAASTGGPAALVRILSELPAGFPLPILVVQHIAPGFIGGFVDWLNVSSALKVNVAADRAALQPGNVYVAPDDRHLGVSDGARIVLSRAAPIGGFRPSASYLFESAAGAFGAASVAVVLTGMGRDGVAGLKTLRASGGMILAQDEASSVVFGMPAAVVEAGLADAVLPLPAMGQRLVELAFHS